MVAVGCSCLLSATVPTVVRVCLLLGHCVAMGCCISNEHTIRHMGPGSLSSPEAGIWVTDTCAVLYCTVPLCSAASDGVCQRDDLTVAGGHRMVTIDGYEDVPPYNELALKKAVSK
jgi:hypothetical protein